MSFFLHGIKVPHRKHTADKEATRLTDVKSVTIPMLMHIGAPETPIVKVGDHVDVGTKIASSEAKLSAPIHASVSGTVTAISDFMISSGKIVPAITIESDGLMTVSEDVKPPVVNCREDLVQAIKDSGVVGLGGAGFPTQIKMNVDPNTIDELIINGAECEPYITSDSYSMTHRVEDIEYGLRALQKHFGLKKIIIGIEENKKSAINAMRQMASRMANTCVKVLPSIYPQGGEKVLVYHTTGKVIEAGKLPISVGCLVSNCTTIACIGSYLKTGLPLVKKCVTVDGGAIANPQNVIVPLGTPVQALIDHCGGFKSAPLKVLYGGPMMGVSITDTSAPILKNTNAIIALTAKEGKKPHDTACIRCGACTNACPFGLAPASILLAYQKKDADALKKLSVDTCMLCGCCSFSCPANRPLVQTNALAKQFLTEERAKEL